MNKNHIASAVFVGALLATPLTSHAALMFNVSLNTSALIGNANGPFTIDLQLNDGSGANVGNNTASLSNFLFGGGAASGSPTPLGGASGGLNSTVLLQDSSFLNLFDQTFNPGSVLSFDVLLSTNVDAGATPDGFFFSLLDGLGNQIPTTGLLSAFLEIDLNSGNPAIQTFSAGDPFAAVGAPVIAPLAVPGTVPEPTTVSLVLMAALVQAARMRRRASGIRYPVLERHGSA